MGRRAPAQAISVASPLPGRLIPLSEVPDPVFAKGLVGGGAAVIPDDDAGVVTAVAPLDGKVVKVMPHAYIVQHASGPAVLVHVGIDTVGLKGEGFTVIAQKGDQVRAGDPMITVDVDPGPLEGPQHVQSRGDPGQRGGRHRSSGLAAGAWKQARTCSTFPENRSHGYGRGTETRLGQKATPGPGVQHVAARRCPAG